MHFLSYIVACDACLKPVALPEIKLRQNTETLAYPYGNSERQRVNNYHRHVLCVCAVYCPHPEDLVHGKILLRGIGGKFHYRSYVEQIGHNNEIEYVCDHDYLLVGPTMATCVHNQWRPRDERRCVLKTHPQPRPQIRNRKQ